MMKGDNSHWMDACHHIGSRDVQRFLHGHTIDYIKNMDLRCRCLLGRGNLRDFGVDTSIRVIYDLVVSSNLSTRVSIAPGTSLKLRYMQ